MPTIRDVASLAGVAPITASRVINHSGYVSDDLRQRVFEAADQLGYVPNTLARSLRSKKSRTLALVLTDITNPFWTTVARGVEDTASDAGFSVFFCNTDELESKQARYLEILAQKRVDGVLLVPTTSDNQPVLYLKQQNIDVVILDRRIPGNNVDIIRCDSEEAAYQLIVRLRKLGHRRIFLLSGPVGVSSADDRVSGYLRGLQDPDQDILPVNILRGEFTLESGYQMTCTALSQNPCPTALFASNNFIAIGALKALQDADVPVPEEMSVVAFDDLPGAIVVDPFLTVAVQPAYEMGRLATLRLIERLSGLHEDQFEEIVLPVQITDRKSTRSIG